MSRAPRAWPHLLRTRDQPADLGPVFAAAHAVGLRLGWLDLDLETTPDPVPSGLEQAAKHGVLRAVAVGGRRSVALKPVAGLPVLRDLLREHMRGTALVLVAGDPAQLADASSQPPISRLELTADHLRILPAAEGGKTVWSGTAAAFVGRLRRPRPW